MFVLYFQAQKRCLHAAYSVAIALLCWRNSEEEVVIGKDLLQNVGRYFCTVWQGGRPWHSGFEEIIQCESSSIGPAVCERDDKGGVNSCRERSSARLICVLMRHLGASVICDRIVFRSGCGRRDVAMQQWFCGLRRVRLAVSSLFLVENARLTNTDDPISSCSISWGLACDARENLEISFLCNPEVCCICRE